MLRHNVACEFKLFFWDALCLRPTCTVGCVRILALLLDLFAHIALLHARNVIFSGRIFDGAVQFVSASVELAIQASGRDSASFGSCGSKLSFWDALCLRPACTVGWCKFSRSFWAFLLTLLSYM